MKFISLGVLSALLLACAPLTEQQQYAREDMRIKDMETFLRQKQQCEADGGVVQMDCRDMCREGRWSVYEMRTARCR